MAKYTSTKALEGERWDSVADRAYGDASQFKEIMNANPVVSMDDKIAGGTYLLVPIIESQPDTTNAALLPPWKQ